MKNSGFTLIEVLVALLISVLIITSVLGSLDYTRKAVDAIHNVVETEKAGPRILELLREDLSRLATYDVSEHRVFLGKDDNIGGADADRIDFLAYRQSTIPMLDPVQNQRVWAPLCEVGYALRRNPNPRMDEFLQLYRREDFLQDDEPFADGVFTLLYERVINFDIGYYAEPALDPYREDSWDSSERESLPFALEVRLDIEMTPRRSMESMGILGANRSRLEFEDFLTIPEETRWVFRHRLHPVLPDPSASSAQEELPSEPTEGEAGGVGGRPPGGEREGGFGVGGRPPGGEREGGGKRP